MIEALSQYNPWWSGEIPLEGIIPREKYLKKLVSYLDNEQIIFLTGLRRIGKTTLMKLVIKELIENKGINPNHILYVSLDDYVFKENSILDILEEYRKLHRISVDDKVYLFLDEIIYQKDYYQQLKTIFDRQNTKIYATSSSSIKLKDTKAFLTGRSYLVEINPLDYKEYLYFKNIKIPLKDLKLNEPYFQDYLKSGGIPYYVLKEEREFLIGLVDDIIYKDIISEHGIKNPQIIKDYFLLLMERSGKQLSINKIANILKISVDSSKKYLSYFNDTFLIRLLSRYGTTNEKLLSPKKIYCSDLGIKFSFTGLRDLGSYFENYIYLQLKQNDVYYLYENGIEIDFYVRDIDTLIELKYNSKMNEKQERLFEDFNASNKMVIDSVYSLEDLNELNLKF
ncbi:ATP-binding protein [Sediminispirochaeta smaragdinae]|uniref:ATPase n=1 Tax=Sediminispirochaeta smaragdinae (strain DSM 11293 / JCM 15392 / SEBR 4228) TaxID=573413 RepID=E1RB27_SEDSS|nr:ATP-binding protein [Sediminispirochaeta smaragdinae]ADK79557.1 ATPase [Sediminispirochaeta smaragdinae DSM 11293]